MAKISEQNMCSQAVVLPARTFCFEIKAILPRPLDLTHFAQAFVGKRPTYSNMPGTCRLALSKACPGEGRDGLKPRMYF
jgi:hypothetical protein